MSQQVSFQTEAALIAMLSRLQDLHDSRREKGAEVSKRIVAPVAGDASGFHLELGFRIIDQLWRIGMEEGPKPVSAQRLFNSLNNQVDELTLDDVQYVLKFLGASREIAFVEGNEKRSLRDTSRLIDTNANMARLTAAGRKYTKVKLQAEDWLLEDRAAKTIVSAIERGLFEKLPQLCEEAIATYNEFNRQITDIEESPSRDVMVHKYIAHEKQYTVLRPQLMRHGFDSMLPVSALLTVLA